MDLEVCRFEEGEQHPDHQQRNDELEYADQVIELGEGLHTAIVEHEEQAEQTELHQPANHRRGVGAGLGQPGEPGGSILARGNHFDCHQAGEGDQGDKAHQVAEQRAVGVHRVANHTAGPRQCCPQFTVNDAQQQHGKPAQQPRKDACGARNGGNVAGGKQPARTEDGSQPDKRKVYQ